MPTLAYKRPTLQQLPRVKLEDQHFNLLEVLRQTGDLTDIQRYRLWRAESELNRRDMEARQRLN